MIFVWFYTATNPMKKLSAIAFVSTLLVLEMPALAQSRPLGNAHRGQVLYAQQCTACHAVDVNKVGPMHRGVLGRRAGRLADYTYSEELADAKIVWTLKTLDAWLADPEELIPGQRMGFAVKSRKERADLVAYLATLK